MRESLKRSAGSQHRVSVELEILTDSEEEARALLKAIKPDNATAPPWLTIREEQLGNRLYIVVEAEIENTQRIGSVRNTIDEILEFLYSLLKSIEETAKTLKQAGRERGKGVEA